MNEIKILDFYADWCAPCKILAPTLERAVKDLQVTIPSLELVKINTDKAPETATQYGVKTIPTLVLLKDGAEVSRKMGVQSLNDLKSWITEYLPRTAE